MGIISDVEAAILAVVNTALGATIKRKGTVPGGWTMKTLEQALQFAPGIYVAFQGAVPGADDGYYDGRFTVYLVNKGAIEPVRRHGNPRVIGAYDMLERLLPPLAVLTVPDIGTLKGGAIDNLFRDAMFDLGGTVYGINLILPNMPFDFEADLTNPSLADFILWHGEAYNEGGIAAGENPLIISEQKLHQE
ncbi:MAG: phage protein Gp37 [Desulfobulbia bacterium]